MNILVTGGTGFIGSHVVVELLSRGHHVTIADTFANSDISVVESIASISGQTPVILNVDLASPKEAEKAFDPALGGYDAVIHLAGLKAVGESVANPLHYYNVNINATLNVLANMKLHGVSRLIFSSSATVYGDQAPTPYREDYAQLRPSNPYGWTKAMAEQIIHDSVRAGDIGSATVLRYFNPAGSHPSGLIGELPKGIPNNLVPIMMRVASGSIPHLEVYGSDYATSDGTCERDYIHVVDLARGHLAALEANHSQGYQVYNLGTGEPTTVLQMIQSFGKVIGREVPYKITQRRPGDLASAFADPRKANRELQWRTTHTLNEILSDAWRWEQSIAKAR